jgi:hypothetical protein
MAVCPGRWAGLGPELCAASLCGAASVGTVRYTVVVRDVVHDLLITEAGLAKLGGRGISAEEAGQILRNPHVIVRNPRGGGQPGTRRLLIGQTDGGRALTPVIEETIDSVTWLIVTAWGATDTERRLLPRTR